MIKIKIVVFSALVVMGVSFSHAAAPSYVLETAPQSNETSPVVTTSTGNILGVSVSSFSLTRVDSALNAAFSAALGANYQRAEITLQNQLTTDFYCGYSATASIGTLTNFFKIAAGDTWPWKLGKGLPVYCFHNSTAAGILTVGGVAWK
jgi:hypothetical protein